MTTWSVKNLLSVSILLVVSRGGGAHDEHVKRRRPHVVGLGMMVGALVVVVVVVAVHGLCRC